MFEIRGRRAYTGHGSERARRERSLVGSFVGRCSLLHGERETERLTARRANVVIDQRATLDSRTTVKRFVE